MEQISEKLSEVEPSSDRFGENQRKVVRSRCIFRQVWRKSTESCPKQVHVQTDLEKINGKLSEVEPSSDRFEGNQQKVVRSRATF
ncbi:hypothetical protein J7E32_05925 [Bacillus sp. ISL-55]|nr:hypothetical protein [Bacillus sp. ISL-55]